MSKNSKQLVRTKLGLERANGHAPVALLVRHLKGGKARFMEFAAYVPQIEPALAPVVEDYNSLKASLQKVVSIDALCRLHGVDPVHFIGVVAEAAIKFRDNASVTLIAISIPEVVERSIKEAMKPGGDKDRKMLFQHAGIIPVPAGQTINVGASASANAGAKAEVVEPERRGLPSFERTMIETDHIIRDQE